MASKKELVNTSLKIPKAMRLTVCLLEATSIKLAAKFAMKIFTTPMRFKIPKREEEMNKNSRQEMVLIPEINKRINIYHLGTEAKKVLLIHGWSGRGTQLHSIADKLVKKGYSVFSFDAPAHGISEGTRSEMTQFITCIHHIDRIYGPFSCAIGHSLGAMSLLNAIKGGFTINKAVIIGSGDIITDIMYDFVNKLGMSIATAEVMIKMFEKKTGQTINNYSAYIAAMEVTNPVLIIHDNSDEDVNVKAAHNIYKHLHNSELIITNGLGHRKILGDSKVLKNIVEFLS